MSTDVTVCKLIEGNIASGRVRICPSVCGAPFWGGVFQVLLQIEGWFSYMWRHYWGSSNFILWLIISWTILGAFDVAPLLEKGQFCLSDGWVPLWGSETLFLGTIAFENLKLHSQQLWFVLSPFPAIICEGRLCFGHHCWRIEDIF